MISMIKRRGVNTTENNNWTCFFVYKTKLIFISIINSIFYFIYAFDHGMNAKKLFIFILFFFMFFCALLHFVKFTTHTLCFCEGEMWWRICEIYRKSHGNDTLKRERKNARKKDFSSEMKKLRMIIFNPRSLLLYLSIS